MKKIKSSFIGKAFFSLILLYLVVFLFLFVFQGIVFRTYYTREKINDIKDEITIFLSKDDYDDLTIEELIFSKNTNTFTSIITLSNISNSFNNLDLTILEVTKDDGTIFIYAPTLSSNNYEIGDEISYTTDTKNNSIYIPNYLSLNGKTLLRSSTSKNYSSEIIDSFNLSEEDYIQSDGKIISIAYNDSPIINSLISNEILNISSENYISIVPYNEGNYYYSNQISEESSNLVFYTFVNINGEDSILVSVYPMDYIDQLVIAANRANVYMFIVVLVILIISAFVYSREFSRPLLFINNKTKELSRLDFTSPRINIDSTDEFSELAQNINTLSANLQATLFQLKEHNKQLSDTIAKENIVENNRRDFIQGMSHELKTPLAVIQASAEAIQNNIYDTKEEKESALILIQEEVKKTKQMLNSMITVYKLDSPDYQKQWVPENIRNLIEDINHSLTPLYKNSMIEVNLDLDNSILSCEKEKIETVITNLFTNAIKYTPNGGKINISLRDTTEEISFKITNYGASIKDEEQDKLFDAFYRVDKSRSRKEGSTGLGLYIVSQTLKQYNSECKVLSDKESVTFSFTIKKVTNHSD